MKKRKLHKMSAVLLTLLFCLSGMVTVNAQPAGVGVDPDVIMLDDFEDGTSSKWAIRPGSRGEKMSFEIMDAANGDIVRFGKHALKVNIDFTGAQPEQTLVAQVSPVDVTIPGNDTGKKRIGMWIYASPGVEGMWYRVATTGGQVDFTPPSRIDWTGWKFVQANLKTGAAFAADGIRFVVLKSYENYKANGYVIIDNIRITNQAFNEDLTPPTVVSLTGNGEDLIGKKFDTDQIALAAEFNDTGAPSSGINYASVRMIVNGYAYKTGDAGFTIDETANTVALTGVRLPKGTHNVEMYVEDNFGHITTKSATFTVEVEGTTVAATPAEQAYVGNPFEMKINTTNSKDIKELQFVLKLDNVGTVDATNGVIFAPSAQAGSTFEFNARNGELTVNLKNDVSAESVETLATINIDISKNSNPTDVLRCSPVSANVTYADDSKSGFSLFEAFSRNVLATYDFTVNKRVVGMPGEVLVTDLEGNPQAGTTVYALSEDMANVIASATTGNDGVAVGMNFTNTAQAVNIYAEKDGKFTYTKLIRTLNPLMTGSPAYIRAGTTADPMTSKTITWVTNPVQSGEVAILKLAKKSEGETKFQEFEGTVKILEYNAVVSSGVLRGNSVTVENLEPETDYIYQVGDGTTWSTTREFTTTKATDKFSFSAFGDLQASSMDMMSRLITMGKTIEEMPEKPLFTLNVGDINDTDDRYDYLSYYGYLFDQRPGFAGIDMISGYGNHEYMGNSNADNIKFLNGHHSPETSDNYDATMVGDGSYAVEYGNMLVINLDWEHKFAGKVTAQDVLREQAKWLEDILSKTDKTWKIVSMHYPIYPYQSTPQSNTILAPIFDKYNVQIMFCGHGHTFERMQVRNGEYLAGSDKDRRHFEPEIGGTLYFQLGDSKYANAQGRWILCEVDGKKMDVIVRDADNNVVEAECFTLYASPIENHTVNFSVVNKEKGTLTATVDGVEITTGTEVEAGKNIVFTATPTELFKVKEWKLNDVVVGGEELTYSIYNLAEAATVTVEFDDLIGIEDSFTPDLNISPNPFVDVVNITGAENSTLYVIDVAGVVVHTQKLQTEAETIQLGHLLPGVYFFHLEKDGQIKTEKTIKK